MECVVYVVVGRVRPDPFPSLPFAPHAQEIFPCARIPKYVPPQDVDVTAAPADLRANGSHCAAHLGSKANQHFFPFSYAVVQTRIAVFLEEEIGHVSD